MDRASISRPELLQECAQLGKSFGAHPEETAGAGSAAGDQPGIGEDAEVLGDSGACDVLKVRRDVAGRQLTAPQQLQDTPPPRLDQDFEDVAHTAKFSGDLR